MALWSFQEELRYDGAKQSRGICDKWLTEGGARLSGEQCRAGARVSFISNAASLSAKVLI